MSVDAEERDDRETAAAAPANDAAASDKKPAGKPDDDNATALKVTDRVADRYKVEFERPMIHFDLPTATAYAAIDEKTRNRYLALVCEPRVPFRTRPLRSLQGRPCAHVLPLRDSGIVMNPYTNTRVLALIMDMPEGGPLTPTMDDLRGVASEKEALDHILPQIVSGLENLLNRGVAHRNVRPTNLYFVDRDRQNLVLGDCVSAPPGANQPAVFETMERMLATPAGRGFGSSAEDMYALGVTMVALIFGRDPADGRSDDTVAAHKIVYGTFQALTGETRFPQPLTSLLRGLMADDINERWTLDLVRAWREGRPIKTKRSLPDRRATAPIQFLGKEFFYRRHLAMALGKKPEDAATFIRGGRLEPWLRRNLEAGKLSEEIGYVLEAVGDSASARAASDPLMVTQILYILDPNGPLRYKDISIMVDGLGPTLAKAYADGDQVSLQALRTVIVRGILEKWVDMQQVLLGASLSTELFGRLNTTARSNDLGQGLERVMYDLNPSMPCLSEAIVDKNCLNIRTLLLALDEVGLTRPDTDLVDNHIVGFICSRSRKVEEQYKGWMRSNDLGDASRDIALLAMFANAQRETYVTKLSGISNWAAKRMAPVINAYHSRSRRDELSKKLKAQIKKGDLMTLLDLLGNPKTRNKDTTEYGDAINHYATMETEIHNLEMDERTRRNLAVRVGHRIAYAISYGILALSASYALFGIL